MQSRSRYTKGQPKAAGSSQFQVDVLDPFLDLLEGPEIKIKSPHYKNMYACLEAELKKEQRRAGALSPKNASALTGLTSTPSDPRPAMGDAPNKTFESFWASNPSVERLQD